MDESRWRHLRGYLDGLKPLALLVLEDGQGAIRLEQGLLARLLAKGERTANQQPPTPCFGDLVCPADGHAILLLRSEGISFPSSGRAYDLRLAGSDAVDGPWLIEAPDISVRTRSEPTEIAMWAVAKPLNRPLKVSYGAPRPVGRVAASVNNLDVGTDDLPVQAGSVRLRFIPRVDQSVLRDLLRIGSLRTASMVQFEFESWENASDSELLEFCRDVGTLCTFASGHHNGVPLMTLYDTSGKTCRRLLVNPVDTAGSSYPLLLSGHTPGAVAQLFAECFAEHQRMQRSTLPWRKLPSYCASIEEGSYLEQRLAAVMTALEFFMRTSLLEANQTNRKRYGSMTLPELIGAARKTLSWDVPKHYVAKDLYRLLRNAVAHGGEPPTLDPVELRHAFDKWRLFLFRRVLIRLGYRGRVYCPKAGWAASSAVDDFSEEHNSFATPSP